MFLIAFAITNQGLNSTNFEKNEIFLTLVKTRFFQKNKKRFIFNIFFENLSKNEILTKFVACNFKNFW